MEYYRGIICFYTEKKEQYIVVNHSRNPNAIIGFSTFEIKAAATINKGKKINIDYRNEPIPEEYKNGFEATYL